MADYLFEIKTPLNVTIHTTSEYWNKLIFKHPELQDRIQDVINTLLSPTEIRKSKRDELIFLYYSPSGKYWLCVVTKHTGLDGFLIYCVYYR